MRDGGMTAQLAPTDRPLSRHLRIESTNRGREYFAVTTFYAVFFSEPWPWMEVREALIGGFPTNWLIPLDPELRGSLVSVGKCT